MGQRVTLVHSIDKSRLDNALTCGIQAVSKFQNVDLDIRQNVVYCWLCKEDDKLHWSDHVYLAVDIDEDKCLVADMDIISLAMMYSQGSGGRQQNDEAARLLAEVYRVTATPLAEYRKGMFSSPEVLVKGNISAENVRIMEE